ncbi:MAG: hypothetical protein WB611_10830 [Stellaceae bacterium]
MAASYYCHQFQKRYQAARFAKFSFDDVSQSRGWYYCHDRLVDMREQVMTGNQHKSVAETAADPKQAKNELLDNEYAM